MCMKIKGGIIMKDLGTLLNKLTQIKELNKKNKDIEKDLVNETKIILEEQGISKGQYDGIKVDYKEVVKLSIDEDKQLSIIKQLAKSNPTILDCIITKEVVDENILEDLIYTGIIDPTDLQPAMIETKSKRLTVKRVK